MSTLFLITSSPQSIMAWHALETVKSFQKKNEAFQVFFYQDGVYVANALNWVTDDLKNLTREWQKLKIQLPVCVSAALNRGITDDQNAQRHQLSQSNLAQGFELVGLGILAEYVQHATRIVHF